jgi:hypothetical protein
MTAERQQGTTSQQLKLRGMGLATSKHAAALHDLQVLARFVARNRHPDAVTIEHVRSVAEMAQKPWTIGNAAGSVFDGDEWECVGFTTAKRPEAHGRVIRQWRLRKSI